MNLKQKVAQGMTIVAGAETTYELWLDNLDMLFIRTARRHGDVASIEWHGMSDSYNQRVFEHMRERAVKT